MTYRLPILTHVQQVVATHVSSKGVSRFYDGDGFYTGSKVWQTMSQTCGETSGSFVLAFLHTSNSVFFVINVANLRLFHRNCKF